ncbi:MAG: fumarylacetoacetate hydrolase family protein [Chloroflexi bacterium]|nr:fumarylacetoacetate hydrolase family protein [Chloroflexota bacterium]
MKLLFFDDFIPGVLRGDTVVDISRVIADIPHVTPHDWMSGLIAGFSRYRDRIEEALNASSPGVPVGEVRLRPPLPKPVNLVCMAANFLEDAAIKEPKPLNAFLKSPNCVIGNGDTVVLPPDKADIFHHEAELALVIGREAADVKAADAYSHIFGYVNFIDVSARGLHQNSLFIGKSWDSFGPMGPFLVTADEVPDPQHLPVKLWVNGELRQDYTTADMGVDIPHTFEWVTSIATLNPGDLLSCGTNHQGLSALQDGDRVEMEAAGLGRLTVTVRDDLKREWPRGIDRGTADRVAGRAKAGGFGRPTTPA